MSGSLTEFESGCKAYEEDLVLHYYGEIAPADRQRVEDHLSSCVPCREFLSDLQKMLPGMAKNEALPPSFWNSYFNETIGKLAEQEERKHWWRRWFQPLNGWMVPAFGTAAVAAIALTFVINTNGIFGNKSTTTLPQEVLADSNKLEFFRSLDMLESLQQLEEQERNRKEPQANRLMPTHGQGTLA